MKGATKRKVSKNYKCQKTINLTSIKKYLNFKLLSSLIKKKTNTNKNSYFLYFIKGEINIVLLDSK